MNPTSAISWSTRPAYRRRMRSSTALPSARGFAWRVPLLPRFEATLQLLVEERGFMPSDHDWERVRRQKGEPLFDAFRVEELQGRLLFLKHEAMISRFHAMLEL